MYKIKWRVYTYVFKVKEFIYEVGWIIFQIIFIFKVTLEYFMTFIYTGKHKKVGQQLKV